MVGTALMAKKLAEPTPRISVVRETVPAAVEAALTKALAKTPADRFATAQQFAEALTAEVVRPQDEVKSIVVLPFENLSPDPDNAFFADGLTEELIADLSKVRALRVISRTSAMLLKGSRKDVPTIARELNVRYVLEGSVRRAGNSLRITAQLIEAPTDAHLWAEKYTGTLEDVFDLQEQLSRRIVEALKVTLTPDEDRHLASRDIPDAEAYALYVRARQEFQKFTEASLDLAEQLVERALARTGPNALLLATAAEIAYGFQDMGYRPAAETLDRGDALATRALELDPNLAEAHVAKGLIAQRRFDIPATVRHALRAVELDPANAMAAWAAGLFLAEVGRTDEAREHGDRARALDPLWWPAQAGSFYADLFDGNYDSALARMVGMHTVSGDNPVADLWLGVCLVYAGRSDEAAAALDRAAAGLLQPQALGSAPALHLRGFFPALPVRLRAELHHVPHRQRAAGARQYRRDRFGQGVRRRDQHRPAQRRTGRAALHPPGLHHSHPAGEGVEGLHAGLAGAGRDEDCRADPHAGQAGTLRQRWALRGGTGTVRGDGR